MTGNGNDGVGGFDFFVGSWDGWQRRLKKPLGNCTEWDEFRSTTQCWSVFGGAGNVDEVSVPDRGFSGLTVRLLDRATAQWSLYWSNSRDGLLPMPPVVGRFVDGVGHFYCDEIWNGIPIVTRFTWSGITPESAHWDQAFSTDGRQTWETNWTAEFTRRR
ncbi:MAG: hypothetical protein ABJB47_04010 [Actinomycetota bacterium]